MDALTKPGDTVGPSRCERSTESRSRSMSCSNGRWPSRWMRYYCCMPCRVLIELEAARPTLEAAGVSVVGVGGAADCQARHLMDHGVDFRLLLDSDHALYEALDVRRIHWWMLLWPRTWWNYLRAARRARQGRITAHPLQAPGFVILDPDHTVRFLYRARTLDYPPTTDIVAVARQS